MELVSPARFDNGVELLKTEAEGETTRCDAYTTTIQ
jgi:hypothetical protein